MERITEKLHDDDSSSSSNDEKKKSRPAAASPAAGLKEKVFRLFGRERHVHHVLDGGKPADVFLWRNKKLSAGILGSVTVVWVLFEQLEYHLLTFVCHFLILALAVLFVYSNATTLLNKSPRIPKVSILEDLTVQVALSLRYEINCGSALLRCVAIGRDLKKFLAVVVGLYVLSVVGSCCNILTLFYLGLDIVAQSSRQMLLDTHASPQTDPPYLPLPYHPAMPSEELSVIVMTSPTTMPSSST